jgi:hypothetical protein
MGMDFQPGLTVIDPGQADEVAEAARNADLPVFIIETGGHVGQN